MAQTSGLAKVRMLHPSTGLPAGRGARFAEVFQDIVWDQLHAWKTHGNRFSPPPMLFRWRREGWPS